MTRRLDLGQIVLVVAAATHVEVAAVIAECDLTLLSMITERTRRAPSPAASASEILVGVAAGRPFVTGNTAAAWALATLVADNHRLRLDVAAADAAALVRAAARGSIDEEDVAEVLDHMLRSRGRSRRMTESVSVTADVPVGAVSRTEITVWACPECGRGLSLPPFRSSILVVEPSPRDVVADCAARHRTHGPAGIVRRYPAVQVFERSDRVLASVGAG